jgi:hypothetical protein
MVRDHLKGGVLRHIEWFGAVAKKESDDLNRISEALGCNLIDTILQPGQGSCPIWWFALAELRLVAEFFVWEI